MSEDALTLEFYTAKLKDKRYRQKLEAIYRSHVQCHDSNDESSIEYQRDKAVYHAAFCSLDTKVINDLIRDLERLGASNALLTAWYDQVGEEIY